MAMCPVAQHWLACFFLVPFNIDFHLAHHADAGVPFRNLPRYHRMLHESGYVTSEYEYPTYRSLWRRLSSQTAASVGLNKVNDRH